MKKTIYTLNVNDYAPQITEITYPLLKRYADKIGAEFFVITERRWPDWPVLQEKFQLYHLIEDRGDDWGIFIDSDCLVHPDAPDYSELASKDTVVQYGRELSLIRYRSDEYFRRDGRFTSTGGFYSVVSNWCRDFFHPLEDLTLSQALERIQPAHAEFAADRDADTQRGHMIEDYVTSRNVARYGLKHRTMQEVLESKGMQDVDPARYFWHTHLVPMDERAALFRKVVAEEGLSV